MHRTISQKCIGPDMFSWIRHYVVEVCVLPSALLVYTVVSSAGFAPTWTDGQTVLLEAYSRDSRRLRHAQEGKGGKGRRHTGCTRTHNRYTDTSNLNK